jgi:hypothetical protein
LETHMAAGFIVGGIVVLVAIVAGYVLRRNNGK